MEYKVVTNEETVLLPFRRHEAAQAAFDAAMAEIWAAQYQALQKMFPERNGIDLDTKQRVETAKEASDRAKELAKLAGMTPAQLKEPVLEALREQLRGFEEEHIRKTDIASHPEAYGERLGEEAEAQWAVALAEQAVLVTQKAIGGWNSKKGDAEDGA